MANPRRQPIPRRIAQLREDLFPAASAGESRAMMAQAVASASKSKERLSVRSIQNAELGRMQFTSTLTAIASVLGVTLDDISKPTGDRGSETDLPTPHLVHYAFGERHRAISALMEWQRTLNVAKVRILAFTGHTIPIQEFLRSSRVELLLGHPSTALKMDMKRQAQLFDAWALMEGPDLQRPVRDKRLEIHRHLCQVAFTGFALDSEVYLINPHLWLPVGVDAKPEAKADLDKLYAVRGITHLPLSKDPVTLAGADLPCTLVVKGGHRVAQDAFEALSGTFELAWAALRAVSSPDEEIMGTP